jgi:hypothetical protein
MDPEIWRPVVGHESLYEVSNRGRARSKDSHIRGKIRKLQPHTSGYLQLRLRGCGSVGVNAYVHHLVAAAFIGPRGRLDVNHKDTDKRNNRVENLEYVTRRENIRHAIAHGRFVFRPKGVPRDTPSGKLPLVRVVRA